MEISTLFLLFCVFLTVEARFNRTIVDNIEKVILNYCNSLANEMESSVNNEREILERLQLEVFDTSASREERLLFIEKIILAYRPKIINPKDFAQQALDHYEKHLEEVKSFGEEYQWAEEAYIRMGRILIESRYYTANSEERQKIVRDVIDDILNRTYA